MKVNLAYGQGHLPVECPEGRTTIIEPTFIEGLADERAAVIAALVATPGTILASQFRAVFQSPPAVLVQVVVDCCAQAHVHANK